jgi:RNA polymerase sigma-70 factor (ECF subfamily)
MTYLDQELLETRESEQPAPFERLEEKEASGFLLKILGTLPPRQQELLQLKFQNDLSYQEIAAVTQLSVSNVGVTIHNALKTLRQRYGQASRDFLPFTPRTVS